MTPEEEAALGLDCDAEDGLLSGDLLPLAILLRSGHPISEEVRNLLADAIEGRGKARPLRMTHKSGWLPEPKKIQRTQKARIIGAFIHLRSLRVERGQWDSIIADAAKEFGVSRPTAAKALTEFRKWRDIPEHCKAFWEDKAILTSAWRRAFPEEYQAWLDSLPE